MKTVWPDTFVSDDTLTQNISTLRRALGDASEHPEYIATMPRRGYQFISTVSELTVAEAAKNSPPAMPARPIRPTFRSKRELFWIALSASLLVATGALAFGYFRSMARAGVPSVWEVIPPRDANLASGGVLSPDGRFLAFVTTDQTGMRVLRVRALGSTDAPGLAGTEGATDPFWSPDSESIAFCAEGKLMRVGLKGQPVRMLAAVDPYARGGSWSRDNVIILPAAFKAGLSRVDANGGPAIPLTTLAPGERAHVWPYFLPDGRHFLYRAVGLSRERSATYIGSLDSTETTRILDASASAAIYAEPGYLLFVRAGSLVAQRFEVERLRLIGPELPVMRNVAQPNLGGLMFSAAARRVLAVVSGGIHTELQWLNREGRPLATLAGTTDLNAPALSPDDSEVLAMRLESEVDAQIWSSASAGGTPARFETGLSRGGLPVWSPDGTSIVFTSAGSIYRVSLLGVRTPELLMKQTTSSPHRVHDWSPDGRFVVYYVTAPETGMDLWALSMADLTAKPIVATRFNELQGQVSPDGRWIAYTSDESGAWEVYVQSFPDGGYKQKVSREGGAQPKWRRTDGKELFYLSADQQMMSVQVRSGSVASLTLGQPQNLFQTRLLNDITAHRNHYAVTRDGERFLVSTVQPTRPVITVMFDWTTGLQ